MVLCASGIDSFQEQQGIFFLVSIGYYGLLPVTMGYRRVTGLLIL
jgi:hypothetical protein